MAICAKPTTGRGNPPHNTTSIMAQAKNSMSKLDRLTTLRDSLLDCCKESVKNADEWQTFHDWLEKVKDMISDEHRRLGYMAVYPIVNGSAQEALFEGTREQCKIYTDILLENKPEMKGNIIVLDYHCGYRPDCSLGSQGE